MSNYLYRQHVGEHSFDNRFAKKEEMEPLLNRVDLTADSIPFNHGGAPFISDTKTAYVDDDDYHTLILGSTGSMKTRVFVIPTIYTLALAGENMVISDPKGEIYDKTSGFLDEKGYEINVLNLRDMAHSDSWNPLTEAYRLYQLGEETRSLRLVQDFIDSLTVKINSEKDPVWTFLASQFILGSVLMLFRAAKDETEVNVQGLLAFMYAGQSMENDLTPLGRVVRSIDPTSLVRQMMDATQISAASTRSGVFANVSASYHIFAANPSLQTLAAKNTFDIHDLAKPDKKHAIFIIVPDETNVFHFFCAAFVKQLYTVLIADASALPNQRLERRLNFVLDEFANIPKIADMPTMITAARSRNIRFFLVVQSDSQLTSMYHNDAKTIKTNCLNWVYLNSKEDELIKQVQTLIGDRLVNGEKVPLMSFSDLSTLKKVNDPKKGGAEAVILLSRSRPYLSFMPDLSRYTQFANRPYKPFPDTDQKGFSVFNVKEVLKWEGNDAAINQLFGPHYVPKALRKKDEEEEKMNALLNNARKRKSE